MCKYTSIMKCFVKKYYPGILATLLCELIIYIIVRKLDNLHYKRVCDAMDREDELLYQEHLTRVNGNT